MIPHRPSHSAARRQPHPAALATVAKASSPVHRENETLRATPRAGRAGGGTVATAPTISPLTYLARPATRALSTATRCGAGCFRGLLATVAKSTMHRGTNDSLARRGRTVGGECGCTVITTPAIGHQLTEILHRDNKPAYHANPATQNLTRVPSRGGPASTIFSPPHAGFLSTESACCPGRRPTPPPQFPSDCFALPKKGRAVLECRHTYSVSGRPSWPENAGSTSFDALLPVRARRP